MDKFYSLPRDYVTSKWVGGGTKGSMDDELGGRMWNDFVNKFRKAYNANHTKKINLLQAAKIASTAYATKSTYARRVKMAKALATAKKPKTTRGKPVKHTSKTKRSSAARGGYEPFFGAGSLWLDHVKQYIADYNATHDVPQSYSASLKAASKTFKKRVGKEKPPGWHGSPGHGEWTKFLKEYIHNYEDTHDVALNYADALSKASRAYKDRVIYPRRKATAAAKKTGKSAAAAIIPRKSETAMVNDLINLLGELPEPPKAILDLLGGPAIGGPASIMDLPVYARASYQEPLLGPPSISIEEVEEAENMPVLANIPRGKNRFPSYVKAYMKLHGMARTEYAKAVQAAKQSYNAQKE